MSKKVYFQSPNRHNLCGILVEPAENKAKSIVILCHGFHSGKDNNTNSRLHKMLAEKKIASLRFDFFGHGKAKVN